MPAVALRLTIITRASLEQWPKLFQNLRSSRQTELEETFPSHVVCRWLGNSRAVAAKQYLQVTDEHFSKAVQHPVQSVQKAVQQPAATVRTDSRKDEKCDTVQLPALQKVAEAGLEPVANSPKKKGDSSRGGAESGAVGARTTQFEPDLQVIIEAWPELSKTVKRDILAMVKSAKDK